MTVKATYTFTCDGCGKTLAPEAQVLRADLPDRQLRADDWFYGRGKSVLVCDWTCLRAAVDKSESA